MEISIVAGWGACRYNNILRIWVFSNTKSYTKPIAPLYFGDHLNLTIILLLSFYLLYT